MIDPLKTQKGALAFVIEFQDMVRRDFEAHGEVKDGAVLFETVSLETGAAHRWIRTTAVLGGSELQVQSSQQFAEALSTLVLASKAVGVVVVFQVWVLSKEKAPPEGEAWDGVEGKREYLYMQLEHTAFTKLRGWWAKITRDEKGPHLGPFEDHGSALEGPYKRLLPRGKTVTHDVH